MLRQATQNLITALYPRLSHEDELQGESNSISNQVDVLLNDMEEKELIVMEATAQGLKKARETAE